MPELNGKAYDACVKLALDVLELKVGETLELTFKDGTMVLRREK